MAADTSIPDDGILRIPSDDIKKRWFIIGSAIVFAPVALVIAWHSPVGWMAMGVLAVVAIIGGLFPEREVDLNQRMVTLYLRLFQRVTVYHWRSQIHDGQVVQIHMRAFGDKRTEGYVHSIVCVEGRSRTGLRDYTRPTDAHDPEIEAFGLSIARALKLCYDGYKDHPAFFWT